MKVKQLYHLLVLPLLCHAYKLNAMSILQPKVEHSADYKWAIQLNQFSLSLLGLWPVETKRKKFGNQLFAVVFVIMVVTTCIGPCACAIIKQYEGVIAMMEKLTYCIGYSIATIKYIVLFSKKKVLLPLVNMVAEDWTKSKTDLERDVMIRRARVGRIFNIFSCVVPPALLVSLMILPNLGFNVQFAASEINATRFLIVPSYFAFDVYRSPYFEITYVAQAICSIITLFAYTSTDIFFGILVLHICGQLENLQASLAKMKQSRSSNSYLAPIVEDHIRLIRATDVVERTFTLLLLALVLYFGSFTCIYGFIVVNMTAGEGKQIPMYHKASVMVMFANTIIQTSLYFIAGQILVNESEGVYSAAYECEWLNLEPNEAKGLILIMARAKTPLYLTAGKLVPITMPSYCNILKISFSYISILLARV